MAQPTKKTKEKKSTKKGKLPANVRSLTKVSGGASYAVTLPREIIRAFKWKERQKLTLEVDTKKKTITIQDWKK